MALSKPAGTNAVSDDDDVCQTCVHDTGNRNVNNFRSGEVYILSPVVIIIITAVVVIGAIVAIVAIRRKKRG